LFTINTIFIAIASVWISQILKFPIRTIVDENQKRKINRTITVVITIVLLPSIFFGYKLVKQEDFRLKADSYVSNVSFYEGNYLLKHEIDVKYNKITLIYGGYQLSEQQKKDIIKKSKDFNLEDATIVVEQGLTFDNMEKRNIELSKLKEQVSQLNTTVNQKQLEIDSILGQQKFGLTILNEIKPLFPQITGCTYAESFNFHDTLDSPVPRTVVVFSHQSILHEVDKKKINNWLRERLKRDKLKIYYEREPSP
jgi:hypothetical protein